MQLGMELKPKEGKQILICKRRTKVKSLLSSL